MSNCTGNSSVYLSCTCAYCLLWDSNLQPNIPQYYTLYKFKHHDQYTTKPCWDSDVKKH